MNRHAMRQTSTTSCSLAFGLAIAMMAACGHQETPVPPPAPAETVQTGDVNGEVFIVTRGGQNLKLGLVTVTAIPEDVISGYLDETRKAGDSGISALEGDRAKAAAEAATANNAAKRAKKRADDFMDQLFSSPSGSAAEKEAMRERPLAEAESVRLAGIARSKQGALDLVLSKQSYFRSPEFYFAGLPAGIASTKTNADGAFHLRLPNRGRFALAAMASREVVGNKEAYYWMVWVSLDGEAEKHVMLANDNLTTSGSPESIIKLAQ